jgi:hypothetical protein
MCNIEAYFSDVYMFIYDLYFDVSGYVALDGWLVDVTIGTKRSWLRCCPGIWQEELRKSRKAG